MFEREFTGKFILKYVIKADKNIGCSHQYLRGDVRTVHCPKTI